MNRRLAIRGGRGRTRVFDSGQFTVSDRPWARRALAGRHALALALALIAGCAGVPREEGPPPVSGNRAVVALVDQARGDAASGREANAGATLERALRIEPRNPRLWQELAKLRLAQGRYGETENLAKKSNSFAGDDRRIQSANWRLIGEARIARGEDTAAREAFRRADQLGP